MKGEKTMKLNLQFFGGSGSGGTGGAPRGYRRATTAERRRVKRATGTAPTYVPNERRQAPRGQKITRAQFERATGRTISGQRINKKRKK